MRTVGHLAAAEGHLDVLEFLCNKTDYAFAIEEREGNTTENGSGPVGQKALNSMT